MSDLSVPHKPFDKDKGNDPGDPTGDYRKYPKGPNFLLIVIMACVVLLLIFGAALVLLKGDASHLLPQHQNSKPNSYLRQPLRTPTDIKVA